MPPSQQSVDEAILDYLNKAKAVVPRRLVNNFLDAIERGAQESKVGDIVPDYAIRSIVETWFKKNRLALPAQLPHFV